MLSSLFWWAITIVIGLLAYAGLLIFIVSQVRGVNAITDTAMAKLGKNKDDRYESRRDAVSAKASLRTM
jgi:hypothetical protein